MVVGPGEADRFLKESLEEFKRLCDDVIICRCNAGPAEKKLIDSYDFRSYEDNREWGKFQPYIKTDLLRRIQKLGCDFILPLDSDETIPSVSDRGIFQRFTDRGFDALQFYVVNLWNDEQHYSKNLSFWNVRFYANDPGKGTQFLKKPLHCGNAPPYFYSIPPRQSYIPHILLHKGLMRREDRMRKANRYQIYDPQAIHKGKEYYDALTADWQGSEYSQEAVLAKIQDYCSSFK